jgi:hypothetical protein
VPTSTQQQAAVSLALHLFKASLIVISPIPFQTAFIDRMLFYVAFRTALNSVNAITNIIDLAQD